MGVGEQRAPRGGELVHRRAAEEATGPTGVVVAEEWEVAQRAPEAVREDVLEDLRFLLFQPYSDIEKRYWQIRRPVGTM